MKEINFQFIFEYAENFVMASIILLLVWIEIWLINKGSKYLKNRILKMSFQEIKIQSFELLDIGKLRLALKGAISFLQITAIVVVIYFSLIIALITFPATEDVARKLIGFIFFPIKDTFFLIVDYLPRFFTVVIIVVIFRYLVKIIKSIVIEVESRRMKISGFESQWARTTGSIIISLLNALMLILIFPYLPGYESLAFKGVAAFLGVLVTIGGSSVIANYMAGIVITYMNSCQKGEWVKIDDSLGEVIERSPFAVKLLTSKKVIVSIPNAKIIATQIHNYSRAMGDQRTHLHTSISIGYDVKWEKVHELLLSAAKKSDQIDGSVPPYVRQMKLDDFYVVYELNAIAKDVRQMEKTHSELQKLILNAFNEAGIEILSPHYRAQRNGNKSANPSKNKS